MSQANVELVRRAWEAFCRHDNETVFALYDPQVEIHDGFWDRSYRGFDGVREYWRDRLAVLDEYTTDIEEWIDAGDAVIAVMHVRARGKQSGVQVESRYWQVCNVREGKLWRFWAYATEDEALKAAGLEE